MAGRDVLVAALLDTFGVHPLLTGFAREQRRNGLAEKTIYGRQRVLHSYLSWLAPRCPTDVASDDIQRFLDTRSLTARSRYTYLSSIAAFYDWLRRDAGVADPTLDIRRPKTSRCLPRPIPTDDLARALGAADARMRAWLSLGAFQGFRCVEMARLTRDAIRENDEPPLVVVHGKGDKYRVLPLNRNVETALRTFGLPRAGHVFRRSDGRPIRADTVSSYINRFLHDLGIPSTAHSLRHRFGTTVYGQTKDLRLTQELMGHADPKTTAVYVQYDPGDAALIVRELGVRSTHPVFQVVAAD